MFDDPLFIIVALAVLAVAAVAAVLIARGGPGKSNDTAAPGSTPKPAPYDMLAYLDERVGVQENRKDVRCLSSQNPMTLHFGLGKVAKVDEVLITWPGETDPTPVSPGFIKVNQALPPVIGQPASKQ